jgi:hypothetical protein
MEEKNKMERKIEVRRKDERSIDPILLLENLSTTPGLRKLGAVEYQKGSIHGFGTFILRPDECYNPQEVGYLISSAGYSVIPINSKLKSQASNFDQIANMLSNLRARIKKGSIRMVRGLEETSDCTGLVSGGAQ